VKKDGSHLEVRTQKKDYGKHDMKRKRRKMETHQNMKKAKNETEGHGRRHNDAKRGHANGNFNMAIAYGQWTIYAKSPKYGEKNKTKQRQDKTRQAKQKKNKTKNALKVLLLQYNRIQLLVQRNLSKREKGHLISEKEKIGAHTWNETNTDGAN